MAEFFHNRGNRILERLKKISSIFVLTFSISIVIFLTVDSCTDHNREIHSLLIKNSTGIIGGTAVYEGRYPWMTALYYDQMFLCGGTLTDPRFVLTAAHCVKDALDENRMEDLEVRIGITDLEEPANSVDVSKIIVHPYPKTHDLALLELSQPINDVPTLPRAQSEGTMPSDYQGQTGTVIGWGESELDDDEFAGVLREAVLPLVASSQCPDLPSRDPNLLICAGFEEGGKDACQGDSGGPLISFQSIELVQIGIVSYGEDCALPETYGAYVRLSSYGDWIDSCILSDTDCLQAVPCWDRSSDGLCDLDEDIQEDGRCDEDDCSLKIVGGISDVSAVPPDLKCPQGGWMLSSGLDENDNGVLEADERLLSRLSCEGNNPYMVETDYSEVNLDCTQGEATVVREGVDEDGNGTLTISEIKTTTISCNTEGAESVLTCTYLPGGSNISRTSMTEMSFGYLLLFGWDGNR